MNPASTSEELVENYFDDLLTRDELRELNRRLVADRATARLFAQLARTDGMLFAHFNQCIAEQALRFDAPAQSDRAVVVRVGAALRARPAWAWRWSRFLERLLGPTGSVIVHIAVILALLKLATYRPPPTTAEVEVMVIEPETVQFEQFEKELEPLPDRPEMVAAIKPPEISATAELPDELTASASVPEPTVDFAALDVRSEVASPLVMRGLYQGRSAGGRATALILYGGQWGHYTEAAVVKALEWLTRRQDADGSWGPNPIPLTGLGLLTFLAHGETTASEPYGTTVEKAIRYLVSRQGPDGRFGATDTQAGPYVHGIAAYAISEAYGLTRIPARKPVMEKATQVILDGQQARGGWDYKYGKGGRRDTSVAGWQIQALKSAYIAGAENPGLKEALEKAAADLKAVQNPETGRFGYTERAGGSDGCTGIGVLCLQLLGQGGEESVKKGLQALRDTGLSWAAQEHEEGWPLYEWYYITQAKFHQGGQAWAGWNSAFARLYIKQQNEDGSWDPPARAEQSQGPVYSTTLAALTLQVYYRFLPTYKPIAVEPISQTDTNDVVIRLE